MTTAVPLRFVKGDATSPQAIEIEASVHMPRIGCGLAGGRWDRIEPLIEAAPCRRGVPVTVYDFDA